jgi:C4-dicarboxylate-specific signal transduction histidine kinase
LQPEELCHAIIYLFFYAARSMKQRYDSEAAYVPMIEITTKEAFNRVVIEIRDNGVQVKPQELKQFFQTFVTKEQMGGFDLGLSLAHDIIVHVYRGRIEAMAVASHLQVQITLDKISF